MWRTPLSEALCGNARPSDQVLWRNMGRYGTVRQPAEVPGAPIWAKSSDAQ